MAEIDANQYESNFVRVKYREKAIQPKLKNVRENVSLSLGKKVKPPEHDPYADIAPVREQPPIYFPGHTQNKRQEQVILSDEGKYREEVRPNMYERMELEQRHHQVKKERDKQIAKREAIKAKMEADIQAMRDEVKKVEEMKLQEEEEEKKRHQARLKERKERGFFWFLKKKKKPQWGEVPTGSAKVKVERDEEEQEEKEMGEQAVSSSISQKFENGEESSSDSDEDGVGTLNEHEKAQFREAAIQLKEQKLVRLRQSKSAYNTIPSSKLRWFARKLSLGIGKREDKVTQVLPWLYIGSATEAAHQQYLLKMGITHILNVTSEIGNHYPQHFVYQRIPVKDTHDVDAFSKFPAAVKFIKRCWDVRGKLYVHCSAGIARAPAMVIAYLIAEKHVTLSDAFEFLQAVRPKVNMNNKFLLDLAHWEVHISPDAGSSVKFHRMWQFYEYNAMRGEPAYSKYLPPDGIFNTAMFLWSDLKRPEDFLD